MFDFGIQSHGAEFRILSAAAEATALVLHRAAPQGYNVLA